MLLADLDFISVRNLKNKQFYNSDGNLYYKMCVCIKDNPRVKILDTDTGMIQQVSYKELLANPIRPFYRDKTFDGFTVLVIGNLYQYREIQGTLIKINNLAFYPMGKHYLLWYKGKIYYNVLLNEPYDLAGYKIWRNNVAYQVWDSETMRFKQTCYFIPETDKGQEIGEAAIEEFSNNAPLYVTKLQMMGYTF